MMNLEIAGALVVFLLILSVVSLIKITALQDKIESLERQIEELREGKERWKTLRK